MNSMDKSIEAAAEAYYYAVVGELGAHASWDEFTKDEKTYHTEKMRAAIAAYRDAEIADLRAQLEAAERDAERYRFLKGNFGICRPFDELLIWHTDEITDEIDAAIDYAARGGERG